jgi:cation diffusion facilitator CzcD-associated flavoprotein CzcO
MATAQQRLRVCVVGAGAAGLCAAKHVAAAHLQPVVFEMSNVVGGTWVYSRKATNSSMYQNLRTNLPKEVMAFLDFPFHSQPESFLHHTEVKAYLEGYSGQFDLLKYIVFNSEVILIEHLEGDEEFWKVKVRNVTTNNVTEYVFHSVMVCNGHYSKQYIPEIPGMSSFGGQIIHSHVYRTPEQFAGRIVAVLGGSASGIDISLELASVADRVFLCHNRTPICGSLPGNLDQRSGIVECISPRTLRLANGDSIEADALIFCTGYNFDVSFLSEKCKVKVVARRVSPLFKHLIHTEFPSLCFVGLPALVVPFPLFDLQAAWFCRVLTGESALPSRAEMDADTERELEAVAVQPGAGTAGRHRRNSESGGRPLQGGA